MHTSINRSNRSAATVYYFCPLFPLALVTRIPTRSRSINAIGTAVSIFLKFRGRVRRKQKRERRIKTLAFPHFGPSSRTSVLRLSHFSPPSPSDEISARFFSFFANGSPRFRATVAPLNQQAIFPACEKKREKRGKRER